MKYNFLLLAILVFTNCFGQNNCIDPRQFLTVNEINRQTNEKLLLLENNKQKILKIDANSLINLEFNQDSMSSKLDYYGNVSLTAKINDEAIKVSPYSKVGEKQGKIGINSASPNEISSHLISLVDQIKSLEYKLNNLFEDSFYNDDSLEDRIIVYKDIRQCLVLSKSYLNYFIKGDLEVLNLYLRLTKQDRLSLVDFANKLEKNSLNLNSIDTINYNKFLIIETGLFEDLQLLMSSVVNYNLKIDNSLSYYGYNAVKYVDSKVQQRHADIEDKLKYMLAEKVGELIYQKLFTGTIDLRESRAKEGDILKISVLWYQNNDSTSLPLELELASFEIKEIGWHINISDSFLLVNRISEPKNDQNLSPSHFKGAPGVSLLFTYGNNGYKNNILKRLEPSVGFNVSYLDFYTDQDMEIGIGAVIGLLNNQIFTTLGYNLNSTDKGVYIGLGFSFVNIAGQIKK